MDYRTLYLSVIGRTDPPTSNKNNIPTRGDKIEIDPSCLSYQALDAIALDGVAHALADRKAEPAILQIIGAPAKDQIRIRPTAPLITHKAKIAGLGQSVRSW